MKPNYKLCIPIVFALSLISSVGSAQLQDMNLLNSPVDISRDFRDFTNTYYLADSLSKFNPATASGEVLYKRHNYITRQAFDNMLGVLRPAAANEFPTTEYAASPSLPFSIEFVSPRTVRIKATSGFQVKPDQESLMLVNGKAPVDKSWKYSRIKGGHRYTSAFGSVTVSEHPWRVAIRDANGKLLTQTVHSRDNADSTFTPIVPFSYVRRASDYSRSMSAAFSLSPNEKIFGCGESFTGFDKRGQKVVLWADDANGVQNETMYKPIPFFMSSRGYGMFMHTSTPITCDFGKYFSGVNSMMIGDDELDLFVFLGEPKEVLNEYTNLTGKSPMPPLWSFGFWMSRITYFSEKDGRDVAAKLRENNIPADVIHYDTGWFTTDWRTDYQFAPDRFKNPAKLLSDLKKEGFHVSLWQLPYFTPKNTLFTELVQHNLVVKDAKGNLPYEDAVLDFSNPATIKWYQDKIAGLLKLGVGAIKVDFGEAAPANGIYHSGRTGFYEHNLYPLRYNKAVADITKQVNGENIIWARSTWAGSQRYPLHWGGDAANTNTAMAAELRAGLSFGLSGFAFWSHDIGGFVQSTPEDLYGRWAAFGFLSSHTRSHGAPPKEPWLYSPAFLKTFRTADEMRYKLMPYIYAQAKDCSERGLPMVRALFVEYPNDPGSWLIDDQYLFGSDMLVAPLLENVQERDVYLPPGKWINYQSGETYTGGWQKIKAGPVKAVVLVRSGAVIPHIKLAQSTMKMDWSNIDLVSYAANGETALGLICLPSDNVLQKISVDGNTLQADPYQGRVKWQIKSYK
ncbi:TIM-barrel domain-containing protein [Paradesertivirga mongoliensis]|uniref:TIM-barrel domain-containing protein n=1 Tax=Paradesertivirga mongoliensis TaxID=2100740 RepID=A0ABW4ZM02_9SPHI|nr:alpha-xylosidase [Pedobacter mongoliensis]